MLLARSFVFLMGYLKVPVWGSIAFLGLGILHSCFLYFTQAPSGCGCSFIPDSLAPSKSHQIAVLKNALLISLILLVPRKRLAS